MEHATWLILWGSPVGIAIFFAGLGVLMWGLGRLRQADVARADFELRERQYLHERTRASAEGDGSGP